MSSLSLSLSSSYRHHYHCPLSLVSNVRRGWGVDRWRPGTIHHLSNVRGGWGMIFRSPGAICGLSNIRGGWGMIFCGPGAVCHRSIYRFTKKNRYVNLFIANSGDDTACSATCSMPSHRHNWRLESTAMLIVAWAGECIEIGADMAMVISLWSVWFSFLFSLFQF